MSWVTRNPKSSLLIAVALIAGSVIFYQIRVLERTLHGFFLGTGIGMLLGVSLTLWIQYRRKKRRERKQDSL